LVEAIEFVVLGWGCWNCVPWLRLLELCSLAEAAVFPAFQQLSGSLPVVVQQPFSNCIVTFQQSLGCRLSSVFFCSFKFFKM